MFKKSSITGVCAEIGKQYTSMAMEFSIWQTCVYLDISPSQLHELTRIGAFTCYHTKGKEPYFKREELEAWRLETPDHDRSQIWSIAYEYMIDKAIKEGKKEAHWEVPGIGIVSFTTEYARIPK